MRENLRFFTLAPAGGGSFFSPAGLILSLTPARNRRKPTFKRGRVKFPLKTSSRALDAFLPLGRIRPCLAPLAGLAVRRENLDNRKKQEWHLKTVDEADEGAPQGANLLTAE